MVLPSYDLKSHVHITKDCNGPCHRIYRKISVLFLFQILLHGGGLEPRTRNKSNGEIFFSSSFLHPGLVLFDFIDFVKEFQFL